jgi:hypothetical protein
MQLKIHLIESLNENAAFSFAHMLKRFGISICDPRAKSFLTRIFPVAKTRDSDEELQVAVSDKFRGVSPLECLLKDSAWRKANMRRRPGADRVRESIRVSFPHPTIQLL